MKNFKMENHLENECVKHEINCPFSGNYLRFINKNIVYYIKL